MLIIKAIIGFIYIGTPLMFEEWVNGDLYSFSCASISRYTHVHVRARTPLPQGGIFAYWLLRADYFSNQTHHNQGRQLARLDLC